MARAVVADVSSLRALRRARDRIDRDYAEHIDIAALAADAGYSLGQFIRMQRNLSHAALLGHPYADEEFAPP